MRAFIFLSAAAIAAEFGSRIRQLRLHANLTQQQLADMAGASLSAIRRLEVAGQGNIELLVRVAQALQATAQLEALFAMPAPSIAELERLALAAPRQRARPLRSSRSARPRSVSPVGTKARP
jgi:transcriptional regulator with XRE-family HTH domain